MTPYRVLFASEWLLGPVDGPSNKGCRLSTLHHGFQLATLGEYVFTPIGRLKGRAMRAADLRRGWHAFETKPDSNGIPDQDDITRIAKAMAPGLPVPVITQRNEWSDIVALLDDEYAISIATKLSVLPASSPLREFTAADHQVMIYGRRDGDALLIDPMHPHSDTYHGKWVPMGDVRQAAAAWGAFYVELFPIGGWTQERLKTKELRAALAASDKKLEVMDGKNDALVEKNGQLRAENAALKAASDCEEVLRAQRQAIADQLREVADGIAAA